MPTAPRQHLPAGQTSKQQYERRRFSAQERGFTVRWQKAKQDWLLQEIGETANAKCRYCNQTLEFTGDGPRRATVDHGIPPTRIHPIGTRDYFNLFWDQNYWVACCLTCNSIKQDKLPNELDEPMRSRLLAVLRSRGMDVTRYG